MDIELFKAVIFNQDIWSEIKKHMYPRSKPRPNGKLTNGENMFDYGTNLDYLQGVTLRVETDFMGNNYIIRQKDPRVQELYSFAENSCGVPNRKGNLKDEEAQQIYACIISNLEAGNTGYVHLTMDGVYTIYDFGKPISPGDFAVLNGEINLIKARSKPLIRDGKVVQPFNFTIIGLMSAARQGNLFLIEHVSKTVNCTREVLYNAILSNSIEAVKLVLSKKFFTRHGTQLSSKVVKMHVRMAIIIGNIDMLDLLAKKSKLTLCDLEYASHHNKMIHEYIKGKYKF